MTDFTTEQQLRIDLHKARVARALIDNGMAPALADRAADAGHYEISEAGAMLVAHNGVTTGDGAHELGLLARALLPAGTVTGPQSAEEYAAHFNAERAAKFNPLDARTPQ